MAELISENFQKHCPGCFRRKDHHAVCPYCGYDESRPRSPLFLPYGAVLAGQYRVGKVLGRPGGFGITYLGWDIYLQQKVAIKEYLPPEIAARIPESQDITVHTQDDRKSFDNGKEQFLREARIVAQLDHPSVVRVRGFFNANDTAYMVMDYYDGMTLDAYFEQVKPVLEPMVASSLMQLVLDGLDYVHQHGVIHRDLKPHNIYIAAIGKPIILDFGAARHAVAGLKSISVVLTEGYAPLEQYQRHGGQGPWTDIYGVGATLYRMITGRGPPVALDRLHRDQLEVDGYAGLPDVLVPIMRKALALKPEDRYQSASAFKLALAIAMGPATSTAPMPRSAAVVSKLSQEEPSKTPLTHELLRDTTRRHTQLPDAVQSAITRPLPEILTKPVAPEPPAAPGSAEAIYRTASNTAPKAQSRWLFPALAVVALAAVGAYALIDSETGSKPRPYVAPARAASVASSASSEAPREAKPQFESSSRSALPAGAMPEMVSVPAGVRNDVDYAAMQIGRTEVTVGQFRTFIERSHYRNPDWDRQPCEGGSGNWDRPGYAQTESHPVVCVNWDDALSYTQWLSQETGRHFRLPSDREWEYAAAAGSTSRYWWGNTLTEANAACADCSRRVPNKP